MLSYRKPAIMTGKDILNSIYLCLLPAELTAPRNAGSGVRPGTRAHVLGIPGSCLIGGIVPVMPSFRKDMASELTPNENGCSKRTPGPAKIYPLNAVSSSEAATAEYIPELTVLNRGGRSNI